MTIRDWLSKTKIKNHKTEKEFVMQRFLRNTLFPLFLMLTCPPTVILVWYINTALDGSVLTFYHLILNNGFFTTLWSIWHPVFWGTAIAWKIIAVFMSVQLLLMRAVPGKTIVGPETLKGHVPIYKNNGFLCFLITIALFLLCTHVLHLFSSTIVYDHFAGILGALNIFSLCFCFILYLKGRFKPSSRDHSTTGNFIFDYYWGTELYPRILGWDVKQFTNCRFGMMGWPLLILSYAAKQHELYGLSDAMIVSVALQLIYVGKFFLWETGYLRSLDIMHDRAGFMICWGCLVWLTCVYTSPALYLVHHPIHLGFFLSSFILIVGMGSILVNYLADRQRQRVRAKNGACLVWSRTPTIIKALYRTQSGETKQNLLL